MYGTTLFVCVIAAFAFVIVEGRSVSSDVPAEGKCEPGKSYKVDCNTCVCGDSGVLACTLALCLDKRSAASDAECAYGETKHIDCNSCSCTKNGYWACTRMACISGGLNDASSGETGGVYRV
ncbi:serine protease inhibitor I/II isoform X2 [Agrilus planipennis]|uniref:Serine protease inhibitor I/II isoform X2 n=1 Tax=Agrilus planipennis TaxID=224129 RepID=A0A7F5QWT2_AGRPL|nr:serine protease inhibitor I/II isoform X2 [Agrilus planipennis]